MKTPDAIRKRIDGLMAEFSFVDAENERDLAMIAQCRAAIEEREASSVAFRIEMAALEFAVEAFNAPADLQALAAARGAERVVKTRSAQRVLEALGRTEQLITAISLKERFLSDMPLTTVSSQLTQLKQKGRVVHQGTQWGLANA